MNQKQTFLSFNFGDLLLCLLMIFVDGWARSNFPEQLDFNSNDVTQRLTGQAFVAVLIGGITGVICFFFYPAGSNEKAVTWLGKFSLIIETVGTFVVACIVSFMAALLLFIISLVFVSEDGNGLVMLLLMAMIASMVAPFILTIRYYRRQGKIRYMHPSLRYLLLLPAIFLATAMMNANAIGIFKEDDMSSASGMTAGAFKLVFNFLFLYVGPRMFATGQTIERKNSANWAIGCTLYFAGLSIGI